MKLIIMGAPGAGKGTITDIIVEKFGVKHISMGDELRKEVASGSELGKQIDDMISKGNLVPDDMATELAKKSIEGVEDFILDGYPRTAYQAGQIVEITPIDAVIFLDASDETVKSRLGGRWSCPKCGEVYHEVNIPPKVKGICDKCGEKLYQRTDDTPEGIQKRLDIFHKNAGDILKHFEERGILIRVDSNKEKEKIEKETIEKLEALGK